MKLIMYESESQSGLIPTMYAVGMRLGYLLADNVACGGYYFIRYSNIARGPATIPAKKKLDILLQWGGDDDEMKETIESLHQTQKYFRKIKHKTAEDIVRVRKTEEAIHQYFDNVWFEEYTSEFYAKGFMRLPWDGDIIKQGVFCAYYTTDADPEREDEKFDPMSRMLMRQGVLASTPQWYIPLLPADFFAFLSAEKITVSPGDEATEDPAKLWLTPCLTFDNVLRLTDNEMMIVRRQMNDKAAPLRAAADEWARMFTNGADGATRLRFFKEHVAAAAQGLQQAFSDIEILQQLPQRSKGNRFEVYFGEVPTALMWEFYREVEVIKDQTWDVLQQKLQEKEGTPERYPVMAYKYVPPPEGTENIDDLTVASRTKKFIAVE